MISSLRRVIVVLALSLNALAGAYYLWAAVDDHLLSSRFFNPEAMPFTLIYMGRGLAPLLAVAAILWSAVIPKRPTSNYPRPRLK